MLKSLATKTAAFATLFVALVALPACDTDAEDGMNARQSFEVDAEDETVALLLATGHVDPINDDFRIYAPQTTADGGDPINDFCPVNGGTWEDECGYCACEFGFVVCVDLECNPAGEVANAAPGHSPIADPYNTTVAPIGEPPHTDPTVN
jgi:hypothetical protein